MLERGRVGEDTQDPRQRLHCNIQLKRRVADGERRSRVIICTSCGAPFVIINYKKIVHNHKNRKAITGINRYTNIEWESQ